MVESVTDVRHSSAAGTALKTLGSDVARLHPLVMLYLLTIVMPLGFDIGSIAMTSVRLLLLVVIIPLTVGLISGQYGRRYPIDWLFFLHVVWAAISLLVNNPNRAIESIGSTGIEFIGGYVLARAYIRTASDFIGLIRVVLALVVLLLPFAILETRSGTAVIPAVIERLPVLTTVTQVDIPMRMSLHRVQAVFAHPIHFGLFCSVALSLTYVGLRNSMSLVGRIVACMAIGLGIFLSLSSGALLAAMLQIGLITWDRIFRNMRRRWLLLVGLFVAMYVTIDILSNRTPLKVMMSYATFSAHTAYYRSIIFDWGMRNVWDNPIFGLGFRPWIRPSYMKTGTIDNFWLVIAIRNGIPGFLLLALGYADAIIRVGRRQFTPGTTLANLKLAWMFTFVGLSFTLSTVHIWTAIYSFVFFMLGSGLWLASVSSEPDRVAGGRPKRRRTVWTQQLESRSQADRSAVLTDAGGDRASGGDPETVDNEIEPPAPQSGPSRSDGPSFTRFPQSSDSTPSRSRRR
ncbi:hypothetical protein DEA8626_03155 [Defluviimonas aquaemixtae]|uniref:O-antigen ligase-related domain-containing protein n=1 Tax=Albidovulum aquaemixtae TaxID=1542388 RepID=A0A2R8BL36_9RHOB|nr:O-antigen ligase family protein [Defluviimonas aquaemixtae]SPH24106.1 hypothetical protein DEA8626_03155 [Defluviimonas aquaemixtae]